MSALDRCLHQRMAFGAVRHVALRSEPDAVELDALKIATEWTTLMARQADAEDRWHGCPTDALNALDTWFGERRPGAPAQAICINDLSRQLWQARRAA